MRCAVIITDRAGRQLLGITDEQALSHVRTFRELPKYMIGDMRITFVVEPTPEDIKTSWWNRLRNRVSPILRGSEPA